MLYTTFGAGGDGAASRYGSGSNKMMRFLAAPASQHCFSLYILYSRGGWKQHA
jgi:hypothetical protein